MDKQNSRFGTKPTSTRPTGSFRAQAAGSYKARSGYTQAAEKRMPKGFGSTIPPKRPAPKAEMSEEEKRAQQKEAKRLEKRQRREDKRLDRQYRSHSGARSRKTLLSVLGILLCTALVIGLLMLIIGNGKRTPHMLPTVQLQEAQEIEVQEGNA